MFLVYIHIIYNVGIHPQMFQNTYQCLLWLYYIPV